MTIEGNRQADEGGEGTAPELSTANEPGTASPTGPPGEHRSHPSGLPSPRRSRRWSRWARVVGVSAAIGLLTALLGFGLSRDPAVIRSPLLGRPAPDFALPTLGGGGTIRLSEFRGQVVVVNFWASWCAACRDEHPNLLAAWERYRDQGVVLLGIDYQDSRGAALGYMAELGGDWPVLDDPGGRTAMAFGVYGVPETFFIGRDGVIAYKQIGASSYELLTDQIQRLLSRDG